MFKTFDADRSIIERKYHMPDRPYDAERFNYHGYDYDSSTGLSNDAMDAGITALAAALDAARLPHVAQKARLFEFVLDNTQLEVAAHDYFIGMRAWGRLISKHTVYKWNSENKQKYPRENEICTAANKSGASFGSLDFDYTVPDWDAMLALGFTGLLKRAEDSYNAHKKDGTLTEKQEIFYRGIETEYKAIIRFIDRLYKLAVSQTHEKAPRIAKCLEHLRDGAPTDSYEVLQFIYIYFMLSESVDHYQVRSLGHGLDQTLYPYFVRDIESGRYTKDEIGEFIAYFLMQWQAIDNYWGQPVYLGGANPDGTTKINELSYYILDIYDKLGLYDPKLQLKIYKSTPRDFVMKALEMIRRGSTSIVLINGDMVTKCLMARGASHEEAVDSVISGCYEYKIKGKGIGIAVAYYNMLKGVSMVLDNGVDKATGLEIGVRTGELESFTRFDEFYKAYLAQTKHMLLDYLDSLDEMAKTIADINPSLMFSATISSCVETLTDAIDGGTDNYMGCLTSGLGTATDALMAVKELVYDKKLVTLTELKAALDADWVGYEPLRARALKSRCKYGNGDAVADGYAAAILQYVYDLIGGKVNSHGGRYTIEMHSARAFIIHGERSAATPDGRKAGMERVADSGCRPKRHHRADKLRDAQAHPEKYRNLQVRVCGWNVLWNNMAGSEQDAYIRRAENIQ